MGYELIQTQTYLDLLPGARQALLVEAIFNVGRIPSVNLIDVEREETHTWTPLMYAGADALDRVIRDPALQDAFVNSPRRGGVYQKARMPITRTVRVKFYPLTLDRGRRADGAGGVDRVGLVG